MGKVEVEKLLDVLMDGKWHSLEEIADKAKIEEYRAKLVVSLLKEFQFIRVNKKSGKIKLDALTLRFLEMLDNLNPASSFYEEMIA